MSELPSGTVTFLFSDIEGSTELLQRLGDDAYQHLLNEHRGLMREAFAAFGGVEVGTEGDSFFVAFPTAEGAVGAAVAAQRSLTEHRWPNEAIVRVRMGVHTGTAIIEGVGYVGLDVHIAARVSSCAHGGQIVCSGATAAALDGRAELLDLGEHRLKDLREAVQIHQVCDDRLPTAFPALRSLTVVPNNLPHQSTSFVGRERELRRVCDALRTDRLVTVTGAGGSGKTRLALQAAATVAGRLAGVWLAELAPLADEALVGDTVALAARIDPDGSRSLEEALFEQIGDREVLLVVDNAEHLVDAVALFVERLLRSTERCRVLVTSREPLGISGEVIVATPALSLPGDGRTIDSSEAVRLFCDRATAARAGFRLEGNESDVERICRRLDGLPLAIELAAARLRSLTPAQIADRLDDRFRLLTGGLRTSIGRHRTLRAAIDWSFDLLSDDERTFALGLSVFPAGISLAEAETAFPDLDVLGTLGGLVDKSLLVFDETAERYRMLETLRDYLMERLRESGDADASRRRMLDMVARIASRSVEGAMHFDEFAMLQRLDAEVGNVRASLDWGFAVRDSSVPRIVASLSWYWFARGHREEVESRLRPALACCPPDDHWSLARINEGLGRVSVSRGEYEAGEANLRNAIDHAQLDGDTWLEARLMHALGFSYRKRGDHAASKAILKSRLEDPRFPADPAGRAVSTGSLGDMALMEGDLASARHWYEQGLAILREFPSPRVEMYYLESLARLALLDGDAPAAEQRATASLTLAQELGDFEHIALSHVHLGLVALDRGDVDRARSIYESAAAAVREGLESVGEDVSLFGAIVAVREGRFADAAGLLGAAAASNESAPGLAPFPAPAVLAAAEQSIRSALTDEEFDAAFARGTEQERTTSRFWSTGL